MFRIDHNTAAAALPTPSAAGTPGFFSNGNPSTGAEATIVTADFLNTVQEELLAIVTQAGITPDKEALTQVFGSVVKLAYGEVVTVNSAASPYTISVSRALLLLVDASAGNVTINLPAANARAGLPIKFIRTDGSANTVTISRAGSDTIQGYLTSLSLHYNPRIPLELAASGSTAWYIITQPEVGRNLSGFVPSAGTDADTALTIGSGHYRSADGSIDIMPIWSTLKKFIDDSFAEGDGVGGMFSGSVAADTEYFCNVIRKNSDPSVIDWGYSTTSSGAPSGWTYCFTAHQEITDGSANMMVAGAPPGGKSFRELPGGGLLVRWPHLNGLVNMYSAANPGTSWVAVTTTNIPSNCDARLIVAIRDLTPAELTVMRIIGGVGDASIAPSGLTNSDLGISDTNTVINEQWIQTDRFNGSSRQVSFRLSASNADISVTINTDGYFNPRV